MESVPLFLDDNGVVFYEPFLMCDEKSRSVNLMLDFLWYDSFFLFNCGSRSMLLEILMIWSGSLVLFAVLLCCRRRLLPLL